MAAAAGEDSSVSDHPHENINSDRIHSSGLTNAGGETQVVFSSSSLLLSSLELSDTTIFEP